MKANDYLKLCHYYKGEEKNPYDIEDIRGGFWLAEYHYFGTEKYRTTAPEWEKYAQEECANDFPYLKDLLQSNEIPLAVKGMLAFTACDILYHSPMEEPKWLKDYGSK